MIDTILSAIYCITARRWLHKTPQWDECPWSRQISSKHRHNKLLFYVTRNLFNTYHLLHPSGYRRSPNAISGQGDIVSSRLLGPGRRLLEWDDPHFTIIERQKHRRLNVTRPVWIKSLLAVWASGGPAFHECLRWHVFFTIYDICDVKNTHYNTDSYTVVVDYIYSHPFDIKTPRKMHCIICIIHIAHNASTDVTIVCFCGCVLSRKVI